MDGCNEQSIKTSVKSWALYLQQDKSRTRVFYDQTAETPQSFISHPQTCSFTCALPSVTQGEDMEIPWQPEVNHTPLLPSPERKRALESLAKKKKDFEELYKLR